MSSRNGAKLFRAGRLRVVHEYRPGALTGVMLGIRTGSRFDGRNPGISHFGEHMLFQGTAESDSTTLNERAAELGGDHDAVTGFETVELSFRVRNRDFADAVTLLAEEALRSSVPQDRFDNERQVILQEIRGYRDDPASFLNDETWARFFSGGLATPPFGTPEGVSRISPSVLRRYLKQRYVAANMVLGVVGGVSRREVERVVTGAFGSVAAGKPQRARGAQVQGTGTVRFRRAGLNQLYLQIFQAVPSTKRSIVALGIANEILGTDPDGRLYREVRERHGLSYELDSSIHAGCGWATFEIEAVAEPRAEQRLQQVIEGVLVDAAEKGFTDEEFRRAKRKLWFAHACLADGKLSRAEAHVDSILSGAPTIREREHYLRTLRKSDVEAAWRRAIRGPRLTGILR